MISLIIPTMNRSGFLARQLRYYQDVGFQGYLCIGDSSNTEHLEPTKKAIERYKHKLKIIYREYPELNDSECLQQLIELAPTTYIAFTADDDYLVPAALEKCALFLEDHPDYSSAHGLGVALTLDSDGIYGEIALINRYPQPQTEEDTATQRLLNHLSNYTVTLFSVHRSESWREMYKDITLLTDKRFTELLPCCLSIIEGKAKELDCFYLVRQGHPQRYFLPGKAEWVANPNYLPSYQVFCDCLSRALAQRDGLSLDEAERIVEQAFHLYLSNTFIEPWQNRFGIQRLLQTARVIPGARQVWRGSRRILRKLNLIGRDEILPSELLAPLSHYRADFAPVYRSITGVTD